MTAKRHPAKSHDPGTQDRPADERPVKSDVPSDEVERVPVIDLDAEIAAQESATTPEPESNEAQAMSERQTQEYYDRLLRLTAEFDNYKKRMAREKADFMRYANENLIKDLLESVDNLERALSHEAEEGTEGLAEGVRMTLKMLLETLARHGVKPVEAVGKPFDPNFHEAVSNAAAEDVENNHVVEEYQRGYVLHDRLIRPAMVQVCRK
ncbi:MAG: nucleotide exchange factor GrpE [Nitrospirota bacterium]|jgi:molecular chaperone GrpE